MKKHNVESDHDVVSGLYKGRLGLGQEGTAEERLQISLYELAEVSRAYVGFSIHGPEHADRRFAEKLERPSAWRRDITQTLVSLVMLCVETLDTEKLKGGMRGTRNELEEQRTL